jgi:membrane-associated phospholipid phosphatase
LPILNRPPISLPERHDTPSMHCSYPMILLLFALELRRLPAIVALALFQLLMGFSAIYLQHHYVSDVLVGMLYAALGYFVERLVSSRDLVAAPPSRVRAPR